ncbi:RHS repeat domain-containing protein [Streptomyces pini]|nr:RHS repeat-associated core domain-containing protein [Streptomyces pini]
MTGPDPDGAGPKTAMSSTTWTSRFWGSPWKTVDANGNTTRIDLDAAGRTLKVWKPTEEPDYPDGNASLVFGYEIPTRTNGSNVPDVVAGPTKITSKTLQSGSTYLASYVYSDGLGQVREAQSPAPGGTGRNVVSTRYDSSGNVTGTSSAFYNSGEAGSGMVLPAVVDLPSYKDVVVDWAGRTTLAKIQVNGVNQTAQRTETAYYGDMTRVIPPAGDWTDTYTDVYGRTVKVVEHNGATSHTTRYTYTRKDELRKITDALGNVTTYGYDWAGQRVNTDDPDGGASQAVYDDNGNVTSTTDGNGVTVTTTYDVLNRPVEVKQGTTVLATYTYDTAPGGKGLPAASASYAGGAAYTTAVAGYDGRGRPTAKTLTVPSEAGVLAGAYTTGLHYDAADHVTAIDYPAVGGLPAETVRTDYTAQGQISALSSGLVTYVARTAYDNLARLTERTYGTTDTTVGTASRAYTYDDANGTGALLTVRTNTSAGNGLAQDDIYTRNDSGVTTSVTDAITQQRECFRYDKLNRLTAAWTTGSGTECATGTTPNTDFGAGPDPYRTEYTYDVIGNIASVTDTTGAGSSTRQYAYAASGPDSVRPHAVTQAGDDTFVYNGAGQMTSRTVEGVTSELDWNGQNRVSRITQKKAGGDEVSTYVYDVAGNVLMRSSANEKVLYLDDHELRASAATTAAQATRYYSAGDTVVAMRTPSDTEEDGVLVWLMSDGQASTQLMILAATGVVTRRRYTPFGDQRGEASLPAETDRGFLGKPEDDATGLSILGARMYDAALGRFLSPDELVTPYDPQNLSSYSYSVNNPVAFSDPSGLDYGCGGGSCEYKEDGTSRSPGDHSVLDAPRRTVTYEDRGQVCRCGKRGPLEVGVVGGYQPPRPPITVVTIPSGPASAQKLAPPKIDVPEGSTGSQSILGKVFDVIGIDTDVNTHGGCISGSGGVYAMGTLELCFLATKAPDGSWDFGMSGSAGISAVGSGMSGDVSYLQSNADDMGQLAGWGWDKEVSAHYYGGLVANHENAFNLDGSLVRNAAQEPVWATTTGGGVGIEAGAEIGVNHTWTWTW